MPTASRRCVPWCLAAVLAVTGCGGATTGNGASGTSDGAAAGSDGHGSEDEALDERAGRGEEDDTSGPESDGSTVRRIDVSSGGAGGFTASADVAGSDAAGGEKQVEGGGSAGARTKATGGTGAARGDQQAGGKQIGAAGSQGAGTANGGGVNNSGGGNGGGGTAGLMTAGAAGSFGGANGAASGNGGSAASAGSGNGGGANPVAGCTLFCAQAAAAACPNAESLGACLAGCVLLLDSEPDCADTYQSFFVCTKIAPFLCNDTGEPEPVGCDTQLGVAVACTLGARPNSTLQ